MGTAKTSKRKSKTTIRRRSRKAPDKRARGAAGNHNRSASGTSLYLYAIAPLRHKFEPVHLEGVDGAARVEPLLCAGFTCWISRVSRGGFAEKSSSNMENPNWLAKAGVRHQQAGRELVRPGPVLPARLGTSFQRE